ncbi:MAG: nickel pincer cofactor biosynthesis protein LarB [Opitutales bacterium]|nr:nickel pincer cofactor biosynthesis protein LarB [Opitutales bacterium]
MNPLSQILQDVQSGKCDLPAAQKRIENLMFADLGHTKADLNRRERTGAGEVVFGQGKSAEQCAEIAKAILTRESGVLITRLSPDKAEKVKAAFPDAFYDELSQIMRIGREREKIENSHIAIVTAGTSDMKAAREAELTANFLGSRTKIYPDCGVAGLHRLASQIEEIRKAGVVIAVAGMEGALASVLAGMLKVPVIALPTSVGYGASFGGLAALLSMINSCANGVSVVNIDNGFGAAYNAHLINSKK